MISDIERLLSEVKDSAGLRQGLQSVKDPDEFVAFASSRGYNFSGDELQEWARKKCVEKAGAGELSEAQLAAVAGGHSAATTAVLIAAALSPVCAFVFGTEYAVRSLVTGEDKLK
jgi:predicted ribosomally synthesized peptide with nif11-like leader